MNCSFSKENKKNVFKITITLRNNKTLIFFYNLRSNKRHYINDLNIKSKKDVLEEMIKRVLKNNVDFKKNNNKALFIIKFIEKIKKKINYVY